MSRSKTRLIFVTGLAATAAAAISPPAHADRVVSVEASRILIQTTSVNESGFRVAAETAEQTATRFRFRMFDLVPDGAILQASSVTMSGGCFRNTTIGAIDCPRRNVIDVRGTSRTDTVDLDLSVSLGIRSNLTGNGGDDKLLGTGANDVISGGSGNDEIRGFAGNDTLRGGNGDDRLYGSSGGDVIEGGNNADYIHGGADGDDLYAHTASDPFHDDEVFDGDRFQAEDGVRDDIFCDATPMFGNTPGAFDNDLDENIGGKCKFA